MAQQIVFLAVLVLTSSLAFAADPSQLQDFCVADFKSPTSVNGYVCKSKDKVVAEDFFLSGFNIPGNTTNPLGVAFTAAFVSQMGGLNTLGIGVSRIDFAPGGLAPPHYHPRATEVLTVLEGELFVGFVTGDYKLYTKQLTTGDVYAFPQGLIHFQYNNSTKKAVAHSGFSSQHPGLILIASAVFQSDPPIPEEIIAKTFGLNNKVIRAILHRDEL